MPSSWRLNGCAIPRSSGSPCSSAGAAARGGDDAPPTRRASSAATPRSRCRRRCASARRRSSCRLTSRVTAKPRRCSTKSCARCRLSWSRPAWTRRTSTSPASAKGPARARDAAEAIRARVRDELAQLRRLRGHRGRTHDREGRLRPREARRAARSARLVATPRSSRRCRCASCRSWGRSWRNACTPRACARSAQAAALDPAWLRRPVRQRGRAAVASARAASTPTPVRALAARARVGLARGHLRTRRRRRRRSCDACCARHAERVGADLRHAGRRARTVTLKLRWPDFTTRHALTTLARPAQSTAQLARRGHRRCSMRCSRHRARRPVRLIGLGATNLVEDVVQLPVRGRAGRSARSASTTQSTRFVTASASRAVVPEAVRGDGSTRSTNEPESRAS